MADKMMRMGARGSDGTAKPIRSDNDGVLRTLLKNRSNEILRDNITVSAGGNEVIDGPTSAPFRIYVDQHSNGGAIWRLVSRVQVESFLMPSVGDKRLLETDGQDVIYGYGSRSSMYTHLIQPQGDRIRMTLYNDIANASNFTVVIFEYSNSSTSDE